MVSSSLKIKWRVWNYMLQTCVNTFAWLLLRLRTKMTRTWNRRGARWWWCNRWTCDFCVYWHVLWFLCCCTWTRDFWTFACCRRTRCWRHRPRSCNHRTCNCWTCCRIRACALWTLTWFLYKKNQKTENTYDHYLEFEVFMKCWNICLPDFLRFSLVQVYVVIRSIVFLFVLWS